MRWYFANKHHPFLIKFIVGFFMLPNITQTISKQNHGEKTAGDYHGDNNSHRAESAMVDLITFKN